MKHGVTIVVHHDRTHNFLGCGCAFCAAMLCFFSAVLLAQPRAADSLKQLLPHLPADTSRVNVLNQLAFELRGVSPRERERFANEAMTLSGTLNFKQGLAQALTNMGGASWEQGHYSAALAYQEQAVRLNDSLHDQTNMAFALNSLGLIYNDQGNYRLALENFLKALKIREANGDKRGRQITIGNIGMVYQQQGDLAAAQQYFFKSLGLAEEINDQRGMSIVLANIGGVYFQQGQYDLALDYNTRALQIAEAIGYNSNAAFVLHKTGLVLTKQGKVREALKYQERAFQTATKANNPRVIAYSLHGIAAAYQSLGRSDEARQYAKRALDTARTVGMAAIIKDAAELLATANAAQGRYKDAYQAYQLFKQMSDSAQNLESRKHIAVLEANYKLRQQEIENDRLQAINHAQYTETQQQRFLIFAVLLGLILVVILAVVLARANSIKKRDNTELHRQQALLEEQSQEIEIVNSQLQEQNLALQTLNHEKNEFLGIAAHDLKNPLASIILGTQLLRIKEDQLTPEKRLERLETLELVAARMQEIITNLLDVNAIESGGVHLQMQEVMLASVTKSVVEEYSDIAKRKRIALHFTSESTLETNILADSSRLREVLENLLSNAVKYSPFDANVHIAVEASTKAARVSVTDRGPGLSDSDKKKLFGKFARLSAKPTAGEHSTGLGLSIVKKLVEMMQGKVWCESDLGKGATFIVEFPRISTFSTECANP
ncbi:MAG: tetratricopeptide repeat protein [Candidatus Kapabacteria bacterium]|nr:tetratricopeptide repeat protein [Candidatus Kapabacteria bacterium]